MLINDSTVADTSILDGWYCHAECPTGYNAQPWSDIEIDVLIQEEK